MNIEMLLKFGKKNHMLKLIESGEVYFNTVDYFRTTEGDVHRSDSMEGTSFIKRIYNIELYHEDKLIGNSNSGKLFLRHKKDSGNIYCLTGIERGQLELDTMSNLKISQELSRFDEYVVVIYAPRYFIKRIDKKINDIGLKMIYCPVKYLDTKDYYGNYNIFHKPIELKYQSEFKLFIQNENKQPMKINIGSIQDIAFMTKVADLKRYKYKLTSEKPTANNR